MFHPAQVPHGGSATPMAQTQTQIASARAAAAYHLELRLHDLPPAPRRSGWLQLGASVSACYRSPGPLPQDGRVLLRLLVAVADDPPAPGAGHLVWSALRAGQSLEVLASGQWPLLTPVDDGVALLPGPQRQPVFAAAAPAVETAGWRRWWQSWRR